MDSDDLVRRAGRLAGRAARAGYSIGRQLPGAGTAERGFRALEHRAMSELRRRLESAEDPYLATLKDAPALPGHTENGHAPASAADEQREPLREAMAGLLHRSTALDRDRARDYLYALILGQLAPDEARILSALSDGTQFPLIDVAERTSLGAAGRVVLRNASTVGKAAGITLLDHVPAYVSRLVGLGLVDIDDESAALASQYEVLLTDENVRAAERVVKKPKFLRRTLRISVLGVSFWQACDPTRKTIESAR